MEEIKSGALKIKEANKLFHDRKAVVQYLPENKKKMGNVAYNTSLRIDTAADDMILFVENKQYLEAQRAYGEMLNNCARCHALVRSW